MGSVMDQERPWEEKERLNGYHTMSLKRLKEEVDDLARMSWEHVAHRQAKEIYDNRLKMEFGE